MSVRFSRMIHETASHSSRGFSSSPRRRDRLRAMIYWFMKYIAIGPLVKAIFRPWIVGRQHVPATGAAIMASNHLSFSDSIFLPLMLDRRMSFLAKSDYFTGKGLKAGPPGCS